MAIKIEMLRCFQAVVDHGRLSDAAAALGRTPSAVSMTLKQLEDHIGAPLFETSRKSRLSTLGEQVYQEALLALAHFERSLATIDSLSRSQAGYVRLAVTPSVAAMILPPIIQAFLADHPGVRIEMHDMTSAAVQRDLQNERADIGLASIPPTEGLARKPLFRDPFGVVCRADTPLARAGLPLTWEAIAREEFITNGLCAQITDPQFQPVLLGARLEVPNTASLLALIRAGVGVTVLPRLAVPEDIADLVFLPLPDATIQREVWMVTSDRIRPTPVVRDFAKAILQAAASDLRGHSDFSFSE
ncbi:LysR family transcriptional regulator [Pararhodobacter oceanensis]|nr:LysR family transcriptional regulator [Pararhodobacter oceanensis]